MVARLLLSLALVSLAACSSGGGSSSSSSTSPLNIAATFSDGGGVSTGNVPSDSADADLPVVIIAPDIAEVTAALNTSVESDNDDLDFDSLTVQQALTTGATLRTGTVTLDGETSMQLQ
jgi:hypothetical protein